MDIGTDSVGWAVTDVNYNLLKCHGKTLWGVRIFDGAKSAEERRGHRTSRRRTEHQHQRIIWLQEIFSDKINNYPAYSGKDSLNHKCGYDDFCKYLKNKIKPLDSRSQYSWIERKNEKIYP